ncbi:hypothetical protein [Acidiphilium acidophilum]|nr:hypothetical protein [Acidiphilium acidophilum]
MNRKFLTLIGTTFGMFAVFVRLALTAFRRTGAAPSASDHG